MTITVNANRRNTTPRAFLSIPGSLLCVVVVMVVVVTEFLVEFTVEFTITDDMEEGVLEFTTRENCNTGQNK